ncbi:MAG TPA: CBS domain-containing protein [Pontiella sp.]
MGLVSDLLDSKGTDVFTVTPDQSVLDATECMAKVSAGSAVVMDKGEAVGIISERDVLRKIVLTGTSVADTPIRQIMSGDLVTVTPETTLDECMSLVTEKRVRHLPVVQDRQLCGIISIGDIVKYLVVEKDFKIKNLESYINGAM